MYNENFCRAYYEAFHGNVEMEDAWRRYLTMVHIANKGDVQKFDRVRSLEKFKKWYERYDQDGEYRKTLTKFFRAIFNNVLPTGTFNYNKILEGTFTDTEIYNLWHDHHNHLERFLNKQGDRYREFYACCH